MVLNVTIKGGKMQKKYTNLNDESNWVLGVTICYIIVGIIFSVWFYFNNFIGKSIFMAVLTILMFINGAVIVNSRYIHLYKQDHDAWKYGVLGLLVVLVPVVYFI